MVSIVKDCSQLPREVAKSLSLKVFKNKLDKYLSGMVYVWLILPWGGRMDFMRALPALLFCKNDALIAGSLGNKCTFLKLVTHLYLSV